MTECDSAVIEYDPETPTYTKEEAKKVFTEGFTTAFEFITKNHIRGDIAEFGSFQGFTAIILSKLMQKYQYPAHLYLFDSFEGFPEFSSAVDKRSWEVKKTKVWRPGLEMWGPGFGSDTPELIGKTVQQYIPHDHIHIHKGFFSETFERTTFQNKLSLVHIDCDLYQSSKEVLDKLFRYDLVQDGTILLFDDYYNGRGNPNLGERRAFAEVMAKNKHYSHSFFYLYSWHGVAMILHDNTVGCSGAARFLKRAKKKIFSKFFAND